MLNVKTLKDAPLRRPNFFSKIDRFILLFLIFIPRLLDLGVFFTPDEPIVLTHARNFAAGMVSGDFSQTLGIGWPGVTMAGWTALFVGLAASDLGAYVAGRFAAALLAGLLLLTIYRLARALWGHRPAFIGVSLLALDPYTLGYTRLLHHEAILALFITLAGLSYLLWLRDSRRHWLGLTGLFTGLALLSKSTALLLGPMLGMMGMGWAIYNGQWRNRRWWLSQSGYAALVALIACLVFFVCWPAMWVDPAGALNHTFARLLNDQEAGTGNLGSFWLGRFTQDPGPLFYPVAFLLEATPWLLLGLAFSFRSVFKGGPRSTLYVSRSLWLFTLTYLVFMTIASKKTSRYLLPAFPPFYLLAGLAFYQISPAVNRQFNQWHNKFHFLYFSPLISRLALLLFLFMFALIYHPYYFTYYNPLLLGWRWAPQILYTGWGEGLDQAARYVQQQPPGTVTPWYQSIFTLFYHGAIDENPLTADHVVLYLSEVQRDIPSPQLIHYFRTRRQPEYTVRLNGIDYAWVYPGPIVGLNRPDPAPQYAIGGDFGSEARLLGYNLYPQPRSGEPLIVTLYWRALAASPVNRFVYLRLVDAAGHVWAKADSPPVMGLWPTTRWQPGMLIEDAHELPILPGTPPGAYRLEVGLYDPASGQVLPASGQPVGQGGGLLLGDVPVAWQSRSTAPDLSGQADVALAANARLLSYDPPPFTAATGDILSLRLVWRETATAAGSNNFVGFAWQPANTDEAASRQFDELPLPVEQWGRGAVLLSQHDVIVPPTLATGEYELRVSLHARPEDGSPPAGEIAALGHINVTAPPHEFERPAEMLTPLGAGQLAQGVTLAGYTVNRADNTLNLTLYWQTVSPLKTRYKVFAQLLAGDNTLVAQSDQFPAAGQRPATGWLPGEIVTDPHSLALPVTLSAGRYRLIAGLYNPLTGQRLPVQNDASGENVVQLGVVHVKR